MSLEIDPFRSRVPLQRSATSAGAQRPVVIGLVNNMPDTALEATEAQFARVLSTAAGALPVRLRFSF